LSSSSPPGEPAVRTHIGRRLKLARDTAGISRRELAQRVGTTAERLTGYERGTHRLTARRLFEIASILDKPVSYFFEDLPEQAARPGAPGVDAEVPAARLRETLELIAAFYRIPDAETRRDVIRLLRGIAVDL